MNYVLNLPETKRILLEGLVNQLSKVPGMAAIVLGGSYAAGAEHADSDLDIGLYYSNSQRFSIEDIRSIARSVSVENLGPLQNSTNGVPGSMEAPGFARNLERWIFYTVTSIRSSRQLMRPAVASYFTITINSRLTVSIA